MYVLSRRGIGVSNELDFKYDSKVGHLNTIITILLQGIEKLKMFNALGGID